jgi:hypothetical protein
MPLNHHGYFLLPIQTQKFFWSGVCQYLFEQGHPEIQNSISFVNMGAVNLYATLRFRFRKPIDVYHRMVQAIAVFGESRVIPSDIVHADVLGPARQCDEKRENFNRLLAQRWRVRNTQITTNPPRSCRSLRAYLNILRIITVTIQITVDLYGLAECVRRQGDSVGSLESIGINSR